MAGKPQNATQMRVARSRQTSEGIVVGGWPLQGVTETTEVEVIKAGKLQNGALIIAARGYRT